MSKRIGVVGGSGLYEMDGLDLLDEVEVETPFGAPSDAYVLGTLAGTRLLERLPERGFALAFKLVLTALAVNLLAGALLWS